MKIRSLRESYFKTISEDLIEFNGGSLKYSFGNMNGEPYIYIDSVSSGDIEGKGIGTQLYQELVKLARDKGVKYILGDQQDLDGRPYHIRTKIPNSVTHAYLDADEIDDEEMEEELVMMNHPVFGYVGRMTEDDGEPIFDPGEYAPIYLETILQ